MRLLLPLFILLAAHTAPAQNLQFEANLSYGSDVLANIGGYVDTAGNEYALVGTEFGLDLVDVTIPSNPQIKFSIPGIQSNWREVKTYKKFAYVTTEGGGGLTIVDMTQLPDTVIYKQYTGNGAIGGQLSTIHALHCDTTTGYLYLYGSNIGGGNTLFLDLSDPWNPDYAGEYIFPGNEYVHDGYVDNDTMYEGHIYGGFFTIVDVTNKSNPVLLASHSTPTSFTHNTWLSVDHKTLFTTDENSGSFLGAFDISDPGNIRELSRYQTAPGSGAIVHNTHILNDYAVTSWYKEGVVIVDVARPDNPIEVGHYDTYSQGSGSGFSGCWGVYPFLPSGTIVASDINNGLFVLTPAYIRGCYLEGVVNDSVTGLPVTNATVQILSSSIYKVTDVLGQFRTGTATAGTYDIEVTRAGYVTKVITGVSLTNGVVTPLTILLEPLQSYSFSGDVNDSITQQLIAGANVYLEGQSLSYSAVSDANGHYSFPGVISDTYTLIVGKWGYRTSCSVVSVTGAFTQSVTLTPGYEDDFTFDNNWLVSGSSANAWQRADPVGTYNGSNVEINPEDDITGDCGSFCFVTDNGGAPYNSHDVDDGNTILTSPVFDATIYSNPELSYYYRYLCIDGVGTPNDSMKFSLSNGSSTVQLAAIPPGAPSNGTWVYQNFIISSFLTPTSTMQLFIEVSDNNPGNIVEGALDEFLVSGQLTIGIKEQQPIPSMSVKPNPFTNEVILRYESGNNNEVNKLTVYDLIGKIVMEENFAGTEIRFGKSLNPGVYLVAVGTENFRTFERIVKQ